MKLVIVEDDHFYAMRLAQLLSDNGCEPEICSSVQHALKLRWEEFSGAIIDVMLPNDPGESVVSMEETRGGFLSGVALCRRLRKQDVRVPFVLISAGSMHGEAEDWASQNDVQFVYKHDGPRSLLNALERIGVLKGVAPPKAFIVHGHDESALAELKDYLQNTLKWQEPTVLREQPGKGKTIIEKFEEFASRMDCVFVLLTPDDPQVQLASNDDKRRARQNVVFELGFFYGQIGRQSGRVIVLKKGPVELPSDIAGIVWVDISSGVKAAGESIRKEVAHLAR